MHLRPFEQFAGVTHRLELSSRDEGVMDAITSLDRRGRVVTEIDSVRSSSLVWSSMRVSVVLPGAGGRRENQHKAAPACVFASRQIVRVIRVPACPLCRAVLVWIISLLDVLNLLTKLLDFNAQFEANGREARIIRFGAQRVGFARELLRKEITAGGRQRRQPRGDPRRAKMGRQPVELFPDIGFRRQKIIAS